MTHDVEMVSASEKCSPRVRARSREYRTTGDFLPDPLKSLCNTGSRENGKPLPVLTLQSGIRIAKMKTLAVPSAQLDRGATAQARSYPVTDRTH